MKKLFLALALISSGLAAKAQQLLVVNKTSCPLDVSARVYDASAPPGFQYIPTSTQPIAGGFGTYTFTSADLLSPAPASPWIFDLGQVASPPVSGCVDGGGVDNPLTSNPYYGMTPTLTYYDCSCGSTIKVIFHATGGVANQPWLEIF